MDRSSSLLSNILRVAPLLAVAGSAACGGDDAGSPSAPVVNQVIEETTFDPSLGIDLSQMTRTSSGMYVQILEEGTGEQVGPGSSVEVAYTGRLSDGTPFDTGTFPLVLGTGGAIAGFDEGVTGMRLDESRLLVIPPALGYGSRGQGSIPPGAILVFFVKLIHID